MRRPLQELFAAVLLSGFTPGGTLCPTIDGNRLLLDGQPMFLKGVNWNPVPKGGQQRHSGEHFRGFIEVDSELMAAVGINAIRTYEPILDTEVLDILWSKGIHVLNTVYIQGDADPESALKPVKKLKDHPAILMWVVGNEWNYNQLYSTATFEEAMARVHEVVDLIKSADPSHPVATVYGMMPAPDQIEYLDNVDVWGLTAYSGISFGNLFDLWSDRTQKPMFVAEFGADAYNELSKSEDEPDQAKATWALSGEIMGHASHNGGMCLGGFLFELADEWWKDAEGSPDVQESGGVAPGDGPFPDGIFNEEYWGMVRNDGTPRQAFVVYGDVYPPDGSTYKVHEPRLRAADVHAGFRLQACGASPGCRRMIGNCCPTKNGTMLACCSKEAVKAAKDKKKVAFPKEDGGEEQDEEKEKKKPPAKHEEPAEPPAPPEPAEPEPGQAPPHCQMGEAVPCCPDGDCGTCAGDQCCPGPRGSVSCPSGSGAVVGGCDHPKLYDCTGQTGIHPPATTTATNTTTSAARRTTTSAPPPSSSSTTTAKRPPSTTTAKPPPSRTTNHTIARNNTTATTTTAARPRPSPTTSSQPAPQPASPSRPHRNRAASHSPKKSDSSAGLRASRMPPAKGGDGAPDVLVPPGAWILGQSQASCNEVCEEAGGCVEGGWPEDKDAFMEIVSGLGSDCEDLQDGGSDFDPSAHDGHCGWRPSNKSSQKDVSRCATKAPDGTRRFCPCRGAPLGLEEVTMKLRLRKLRAEDPDPQSAAGAPPGAAGGALFA